MQLSFTSSLLASSVGFGDISASLATVSMQGTVRLIFSARDGNLLSSLNLGPAPAASPQGDVAYFAQFGPDFAYQTTETLPRLFNLSAFNMPMVMNTVLANGTPNWAQVVVTAQGASITDAIAAQVLEFSSGDWLAVAQRLSAGLTLHRLSDSGGLSAPIQLADTPKTFLNGISDTATIARGGDQLLLTLSAQENGISTFLIGADGAAVWVDSYGAQNGMAMSGPAMLQVVQIGGVDFALVAGTNSSSITVLRINVMGVIFETDHVIDTRDTRFANIAAFDGFVAQGRFFILAAGTDSGLTLFELLPNGTLSHMETFVLEGGVGLTAVTALKAQVMGSQVAVFMVDSGADQIFRFDLALGNLGGRIAASGGVATGTGADERLLGSANADVIQAGGGADFLHDGAGADTLTGGAGEDIFIFARDGSVDRITDFQDGVDRLDVSSWGRIYSAQSLAITSTATGAEITFGDERLIITSSTGAPLAASAFTDADFIF